MRIPPLIGRVFATGRDFTIVGILPPEFSFATLSRFWIPLRLTADSDRTVRAIAMAGHSVGRDSAPRLSKCETSSKPRRRELRAHAAEAAQVVITTGVQTGVEPLQDALVQT